MSFDMVDLVLQEVSSYAPKKLHKIEKTFTQLKKSVNNKTARADLVNHIKEFTKIERVIIYFDSQEYNAAVVPVYKKSSIYNAIKEMIAGLLTADVNNWKSIEPTKLAKLVSVEESSEMVETIYLYIGKPLLKDMTPSEMTAILLHELGHVYSASSSIPLLLARFLKGIIGFLRNFSFVFSMKILIVNFAETLILQTLASFIFITTIFLHGITFRERVHEYRADNYAVKYGYGDELIYAMEKLTQISKKSNNGFDLKEIFKSFISFIGFLLLPSTHPSGEKRIKNITEQIFTKYKKLYPNYKDFLERIQSDYNNKRK